MCKLKHGNSILENFEYLCQISSKLILRIFSYTVSKVVRFFETQYMTSYLTSVVTLVLACRVSQILGLLYAKSRFFDTRPKFQGVPLEIDPRCWGLRRANIPR